MSRKKPFINNLIIVLFLSTVFSCKQYVYIPIIISEKDNSETSTPEPEPETPEETPSENNTPAAPLKLSGTINENSLSINGTTFANTDFVTVIPTGSTVTIPDGNNLTHIGDVFHSDRTITLSPFTICKYEVTQELYEYVIKKNPFPDEENLYGNEDQKLRPVAGVNWLEAVYFCNELSKLCGYDPVFTITNIRYSNNKSRTYKYISSASISWDLSKNGFRLPTEAEWEYAARGSGTSAESWAYKYSGGNNSKKTAWTTLTSSGTSDEDETYRTHQTGLKSPNGLGIYDMSGNVAEWCMDWYRSVTEDNDFSRGNAVKDSGAVTDPIMQKGTYDNHVIRGGAYNQDKGYSSTTQRLSYPAYTGYGTDTTNTSQGIRLVRRTQQ